MWKHGTKSSRRENNNDTKFQRRRCGWCVRAPGGQGSGDAMSRGELAEEADREQPTQTHGCLVRRGSEI